MTTPDPYKVTVLPSLRWKEEPFEFDSFHNFFATSGYMLGHLLEFVIPEGFPNIPHIENKTHGKLNMDSITTELQRHGAEPGEKLRFFCWYALTRDENVLLETR